MSYAPQSSSGPFWLPACALYLGLALAAPLAAQSGPAPSVPAPAEPTQTVDGDTFEAGHDTPLHATPDGAPVGTLGTGATGRVVSRANGWVRVHVEGWVREADIRPGTGTALVGVTAAEVRAAPARYVGQTLDWRLQLIAVQTADELRPELPAGQPYLLTRGPLPEAGFVYVTLSKPQAEQLAALPPLEELVLRVTIRAARTRYLETPVVELVTVVAGGNGAAKAGARP